MFIYLILTGYLHANPHCAIHCQEQANEKLVTSCVKAYNNYVNRHFMTPEEAIQRLKSSSIMSQRCDIVGTKIYANQERLDRDSNVCITNYCSVEIYNKNSAEEETLFTIKKNQVEPDGNDKIIQNLKNIKSSVVKNKKSASKIKFQPTNCGQDPSCVKRDIQRCEEHNNNQNAETFDCRSYYSNLNLFSALKETMSFLSNEGGLSGLNHKIQQVMQTCESSHSSAETCCGDSLSCGVGSEPGGKGQYLKMITNMTQIINSAGGLPEKCHALKNISRAGTAGVMAFSTNCFKAVDKCHDSCKPYMDTIKQINHQKTQAQCHLANDFSSSELDYLFGLNSKSYIEFCSDKLKLSNHKDSYRSFYAQCTGFKSEATKANTDIGGLQGITEWTSKCEQYSKNNNEFKTSQTNFNNDCTNPAHYSNPICVQCRLDSSIAQCKGIKLNSNTNETKALNNSIKENSNNDNGFLGLSNFGTQAVSDENPGLADLKTINPDANQGLTTSGTGSSSAAGLAQDNIQALGTEPESNTQTGASSYNTNILGKASGGGGYSNSNTGGGYSNRITTDIYDNTPATGIIKDGYDLKEYLPGGKAYKSKSRLPAGYVQLKNGEIIGPKHGNIFKMMHERYAYYDLLGKFWPSNYSKEKIECIKKSGIMNSPPYSNQWTEENLHKYTPTPNPPECQHFADHDPNKLDATQIYLKAQAKKQLKKTTPQSMVAKYKNKSLREIYHVLTKKKQDFTKAQYKELYKLYKTKYADFKKSQLNNK